MGDPVQLVRIYNKVPGRVGRVGRAVVAEDRGDSASSSIVSSSSLNTTNCECVCVRQRQRQRKIDRERDQNMVLNLLRYHHRDK